MFAIHTAFHVSANQLCMDCRDWGFFYQLWPCSDLMVVQVSVKRGYLFVYLQGPGLTVKRDYIFNSLTAV